MNRSMLRLVLPLFVLLTLVSCTGEGLFPTTPASRNAALTGTLVVTVTNAGVPAGGIQVVMNQDVVGTTDALGQARFAELRPGVYTVSILVPQGFILDSTLAATQNVTVTAGGTATVNWVIRPGENVGGQPGA
ncbi:MAG: prealbumin-like fold domain-containing protein [Gemmatimonadota bacterium]|nr:prealbumin-like fold domain-containing protein [Gemmatimonadota bacterium]